MKKLFSANKYGSLALALAAFAVAGTAPVFAESSGAWSAGISGRSGRPYVHTASTNHNRLFLGGTIEKYASEGPWCHTFGGSGGSIENCSLRTFEMCRQEISGNGGSCSPNPRTAAVPPSLGRVDRFGQVLQR